MLATITIQSHGIKTMKDQQVRRNTNTAGSALPLIPRRTPSSSRTPSVSGPSSAVTMPAVSDSANQPTGVTPLDDSDSGSSSASEKSLPMIAVRSKRARRIRLPAICPPEQSTPIPPFPPAKSDGPKKPRPQISITLADTPGRGTADSSSNDSTPRPTVSRPLTYAPGVPLRLTAAAPRTGRPESSTSAGFPYATEPAIQSAPLEKYPPEHPKLVRKKSGQLVKSSLKSSKRAPRGNLSIVTMAALSKSEPSTPTHKAVHFDSQLEHVKLFLAEQKPLAVSRDGSPTDDTSGTDTDFPSFIFGDNSENNKGRLDMRIANMPRKINPNADVALEEFKLSPDLTNIIGRVRVRNIAFHKWIAVRFTFDFWQTTSEVTAKYLESLSCNFDRFTFNIRLNDLLPRIEGKMMYLAVRYSVSEREIWDNNGGQNYFATFTMVKTRPKLTFPFPKSEDKGSLEVSGMANLRSKLEKVAQGRDAKADNQAARTEVAKREREFVLKTNASLVSRYDFGDHNTPRAMGASPPAKHTRTQSYPAHSALGPSSVAWPEKTPRVTRKTFALPRSEATATLGSPRDAEEERHPAPPNIQGSHRTGRDGAIRNHQRGYFDLNVFQGSGVRKTPPGTPHSRSFDDMTPLSTTRFYSFPPLDNVLLSVPRRAYAHVGPSVVSSADSEQSTPSVAYSSSSGSSRSTSPSPTHEFMMTQMSAQRVEGVPPSPNAHYHQFLNKFCFYTGSDSGPNTAPLPIHRTQSESDVDEFLAGTSPNLRSFSQHILTTPPRSPLIRSGSSTPTALSLNPPPTRPQATKV